MLLPGVFRICSDLRTSRIRAVAAPPDGWQNLLTSGDVPLVSVVIPTYNRAQRLPRAIDSCLAQTYPNVEVIVVDDGSTDDTQALLARYVQEHGEDRVRTALLAHQGAWVARNKGLDLARGRYIQLLDSDDCLSPRKFELQVAALESSGNDLCVCDSRFVTDPPDPENDKTIRVKPDANLPGTIFAPLMRADRIGTDLRFQQMPGQYYDDRDFLFRYCLWVGQWDYVPEALGYYVRHGEARIINAGHAKPWSDLFNSVWTYYQSHKDCIPPTGRRTIRTGGLTLARKLLNRGRRDEARSICLRLLSVPGSLRQRITAFRIVVQSFLPMSITRRASTSKQRIHGGRR